MESICKRMLPVLCLLLSACDGSQQRIQCGDPELTTECQKILRSCGADVAVTPQTVVGAGTAVRLATCLKRTYAARCNAACQVTE